MEAVELFPTIFWLYLLSLGMAIFSLLACCAYEISAMRKISQQLDDTMNIQRAAQDYVPGTSHAGIKTDGVFVHRTSRRAHGIAEAADAPVRAG
ncbi:hypothetical protein EOS_35505 [Caballeronia mineralivorans PML1(12)]|uniref:Uncharacterized protein n=1 Tax=Caballeronia mineralivorans PML1(12) TaxID=908627 RepID=A0A0J1CLT8_9BURK|nr:hypothetical protein [Caballeronia mineralivorans]KLU21484.1 hypothetical protein EOS_35505 [Caballeronia mineralivorans PML1(12)]